jgi:hypothetical protein
MRSVLATAAACLATAVATAHEGHDHKIMGTISAISADRIEVKDTDARIVSISLNAKTKVLRGKTAIKVADLKEGERVVVNVGPGKEPLTAKEILVGGARTT